MAKQLEKGGAMVEQKKKGAIAQLGTPGTRTTNKKQGATTKNTKNKSKSK